MRVSAPLAFSSAARASRRSRRRAVRMSFAPYEASSRARATPIPELAPVMSAHLFWKSVVFAITQ